MKHRLSTTFGHNEVTVEQREKLVRSVFNRVAKRYDLMNDLMSLGIHRLWKWRFCREVKEHSGEVIVDLAGGTGDIAATLVSPEREIIIIDASSPMLGVARQRLKQQAHYIEAEAENIPLPDNSVDILTISFGIRNTTDINKALQEITRVLKPGGHFYCLEFSTPHAWFRPFYNLWSRWVIPHLGAWVAGHSDAYHYLIESIREFPPQQELLQLLEKSGLDQVSFSNLSLGIVCIHRGRKPG